MNERQYKAGLRYGKWGYPVTECPFAPSDTSAEAKAWRQGWVVGSTALRAVLTPEERKKAGLS